MECWRQEKRSSRRGPDTNFVAAMRWLAVQAMPVRATSAADSYWVLDGRGCFRKTLKKLRSAMTQKPWRSSAPKPRATFCGIDLGRDLFSLRQRTASEESNPPAKGCPVVARRRSGGRHTVRSRPRRVVTPFARLPVRRASKRRRRHPAEPSALACVVVIGKQGRQKSPQRPAGDQLVSRRDVRCEVAVLVVERDRAAQQCVDVLKAG